MVKYFSLARRSAPHITISCKADRRVCLVPTFLRSAGFRSRVFPFLIYIYYIYCVPAEISPRSKQAFLIVGDPGKSFVLLFLTRFSILPSQTSLNKISNIYLLFSPKKSFSSSPQTIYGSSYTLYILAPTKTPLLLLSASSKTFPAVRKKRSAIPCSHPSRSLLSVQAASPFFHLQYSI